MARHRNEFSPGSQVHPDLSRYLATSSHMLKVVMLRDLEESDIVPLMQDLVLMKIPILEILLGKVNTGFVDQVVAQSGTADTPGECSTKSKNNTGFAL
ncbi:hypothetical protein D9756_010713 [Leucocoprinus leucothites]|uniref:Uncharacterized protein n=1 Tax=Leucocoprinus leucothites TaxID=201217 RepID=A0A8H5FS52_9AGAR|nr:hypothetical protein D9756_010713 [Leucoagaricus leucothites]